MKFLVILATAILLCSIFEVSSAKRRRFSPPKYGSKSLKLRKPAENHDHAHHSEGHLSHPDVHLNRLTRNRRGLNGLSIPSQNYNLYRYRASMYNNINDERRDLFGDIHDAYIHKRAVRDADFKKLFFEDLKKPSYSTQQNGDSTKWQPQRVLSRSSKNLNVPLASSYLKLRPFGRSYPDLNKDSKYNAYPVNKGLTEELINVERPWTNAVPLEGSDPEILLDPAMKNLHTFFGELDQHYKSGGQQ